VVRLVLNASVVVKWLLADEPLVPEARKLLQEFQEGVWEEFIVPEFCLREVANALWVAYHRGRITEEEARIGWLSFLQLNLSVLPDPPLSDVFGLCPSSRHPRLRQHLHRARSTGRLSIAHC